MIALLVAARLLVATATTVTLAWDPVSDSRLAGYKIHYGTVSKNYTVTQDVGNVTQYTVLNLTEGTTYYFVVSAYGRSDETSGYSNEVSSTPGPLQLFPPVITLTGELQLIARKQPTASKVLYNVDWKKATQGPAKVYNRRTP